jgi:pyruvate dehydrogenase E1 component alpha subunit/2-oxoisovalerate dehydrogenase E1 component alpha subunit
VERLPLVLVITNNHYAYSTPNEDQFACRSLVEKAAGYGVRGVELDGTDLAACLETVGDAVRRAREGQGPQLVVATLLRLCGHGEHDDGSYMDPKYKCSPVGRDCLKAAEEQLLASGLASASDLSEWREMAVREVETAVGQAQREAAPDPFKEEWCALASKHLQEGYLSTEA